MVYRIIIFVWLLVFIQSCGYEKSPIETNHKAALQLLSSIELNYYDIVALDSSYISNIRMMNDEIEVDDLEYQMMLKGMISEYINTLRPELWGNFFNQQIAKLTEQHKLEKEYGLNSDLSSQYLELMRIYYTHNTYLNEDQSTAISKQLGELGGMITGDAYKDIINRFNKTLNDFETQIESFLRDF